MSWNPWHHEISMSGLGVFDTTPVAEQFTGTLDSEMRRAALLEQYVQQRDVLGPKAAFKWLMDSMTALSLAISARQSLPYQVTFVGSTKSVVTGSSKRRKSMRQQFVKVEIRVPTPKKGYVPPSDPTSIDLAYRELRKRITPTLAHEFQHVIQSMARDPRTSGPVVYQQYARGTPQRERAYLTAPGEVVSFSISIANQLKAAGLRAPGFPASEQALAASKTLRRLYETFDWRDPRGARVLKDYAIRVARFM